MTRLLQSLGSDVERAMTDVNVPSYIIDRNGVVAWLNPAAESIVGDVRGMRFTDVVTPGDRPRAKEAFARKILGKEKVTDAEVDLVGADGREVSVEVSSVPLKEGHQIVGVFGLLSRPPSPPKSPQPHAKLTPRQREAQEQGRNRHPRKALHGATPEEGCQPRKSWTRASSEDISEGE